MKRRAFLLFIVLLMLPGLASAVTFKISDYRMAVEVQPDGAGLFTETLVYEFEGSYNGMTATIRHKGMDDFTDLRVFVDGVIELEWVSELSGIPFTFTAETEGDATYIKAYTPGRDDARMFRIEYRMAGLARRYLDTGRINQILLSAEADFPRAVFEVLLPGTDGAQAQAFVHGTKDITGVSLENGVLTVGPGAVKSGEMVEIDVLFPAEWLPDSRIIQSNVREAALLREQEIAVEEASRAEAQARTQRIMRMGCMALLAVYAAGFALLFFRMKAKYGFRNPTQPVTDEAALSAIPSAMAQVLMDKHVTTRGLCATLLELCEKGALSMRQEEGDTCFTLQKREGDLLKHQKELIRWLFEEREALWMGSLDAGESYEEAQRFVNGYNRWKSAVMEDVRGAGWMFANAGAKALACLGSLVLGLLLGGAVLWLALPWLFALLAALLGVCFCAAFSLLRRLTDEGEVKLSVLAGFIENYRDMLEETPQTVLLHAPLVMALGYLEPMAEWIDRHPECAGDSYFGDSPAWMYAGWHVHMRSMDRTMRDAHHHNTNVHNPDDHSGGGGGSSGGSGGGSSHGAW